MASESDAEAGRPAVWLVDGFNLLHAAVLRRESRAGWWGRANRDRVVDLVRGLDAPQAEVVVVFDGPGGSAGEVEAAAPGAPRVVFASPADEWLLAAVRAAADPARVALVTADRQLAERARRRGARVVRPTAFAALCRDAGDPEPDASL